MVSASSAQEAFKLLASKDVRDAIDHAEKLKELIQSKKSQHIQRHERTPGFEYLNMHSNLQETKGIPKSRIVSTINKQLVPFAKRAGSKFEEFVGNIWENLDVDSHSEQSFAINANTGKGTAHFLFISFVKRDDGKYNFRKLLFEGAFTLAADVMVIRESKSNLFRSSSKDVIKYVPRHGITQEDVQALLDVIVPQTAQVMARLELMEDNNKANIVHKKQEL